MNQALFESITGHFLDKSKLHTIPEGKRFSHSIMDHLNRIFNTRMGSISHLKNYGLPDISEIYRKMPDGIDELRNAIKLTVELYEPRLKDITVERKKDNEKEARLVFILSARLKREGTKISFQTTFISTGNSTISPWKKPQ